MKIDYDGYATEPANYLTVECAADGEVQFDGPKMTSDAEAGVPVALCGMLRGDLLCRRLPDREAEHGG